MPFLRSIAAKASLGRRAEDVSVLGARRACARDARAFRRAVTFFVGENGSGKSTLLEGNRGGGWSANRWQRRGARRRHARGSASARRAVCGLSWSRRTHKGFFLRAEDFFGFTKYVARLRAELQGRLAEIDVEYATRSAYAQGLASGTVGQRRWPSSSNGTAWTSTRTRTARAFCGCSGHGSCPAGCTCWTSPKRRCRRRASSGSSRC